MKKEIKPVIYSITNKNNGKKYVGSAMNYNVRRVRHLSELRRQRHHSSKLQNSFNKHGENVFEFGILEVVEDINQLIQTEQKWIDKLKPEYNMTLIAGLNSNLGMKRSEETRKKMSQARIGMVFSETHKKNISKGKKGVSIDGTNMNKDKKGKPLNAEHKLKISLSNKGRQTSEESRKKISDTLKSKNLKSAVSIIVKKYNMDGILLAEYKTMKEAEIDNGYKRDGLRYHLVKKNKKTYNDFVWEVIKTTYYDK
jgi:group I intron endonuclease